MNDFGTMLHHTWLDIRSIAPYSDHLNLLAISIRIDVSLWISIQTNVCLSISKPELKLALSFPLQICHRLPIHIDLSIRIILGRNDSPLLPILVPLHLLIDIDLSVDKVDVIPAKGKRFADSRSTSISKEQWCITRMSFRESNKISFTASRSNGTLSFERSFLEAFQDGSSTSNASFLTTHFIRFAYLSALEMIPFTLEIVFREYP